LSIERFAKKHSQYHSSSVTHAYFLDAPAIEFTVVSGSAFDWRIAKAYVALAEDEEPDTDVKKEDDRKTKIISYQGSGTLEAQAIDRYLDDAEWEENERREGRGVSIQSFPIGGFGGKEISSSSARGSFKWPWSL